MSKEERKVKVDEEEEKVSNLSIYKNQKDDNVVAEAALEAGVLNRDQIMQI